MWQVWALALRLALQRLFIEFDCRLRHIERCGGVARRGRRLGFPSYFNESAARARTHSKAQVKQLAAAIERYANTAIMEMVQPIVTNWSIAQGFGS